MPAQGGADWRERLTALLADYRARPRPVTSKDRWQAALDWQSELVDAGLAAPSWPRSVGGMELPLADQLDYYRMMTAAGVPRHPFTMSFIVAPTLIVHGTDAQRHRFLEPLLRGKEGWCQGFSEPGAGSDIASLSTRAVRDGDVYRVTGQKIWTTLAHKADWIFALVRTGPAGRSTSGITYLLIDMRTPGIEVRPLRDIAGGHHFAEVFFDDVEVPVANRVGEEGEGWAIMRTSLGHERATAALADEFKYRKTVDQVFAQADKQGYRDDPHVLQELARLETDVRTIVSNSARALDAALRQEDPMGVSSINRLVKSEFEQRLQRLALRLGGSGAMLGSRSEGAVDGGRWTYGYLMSRAATIGAGTAEIQRNTIAESVLGLPSHRGEGRRKPLVPPGTPLTAPSDDEAAVREAVAAIVSAHVDPHRIIAGEAVSAELWNSLVDFGLPGLCADEAVGGGGARLRLLCAAIEQAAFGLAPGGLIDAATALALVPAGDHARRIVGGAKVAVVVGLDDTGWVLDSRAPTLSDGVLTGTVERVRGAGDAELFVVITGAASVVVLDADRATVTAQEALDLTGTSGTVSFDAVPATAIPADIAAAQRLWRLLLATDAVGVASRALALAVDWAGQREQFGRQIGSFQAVSHRCADMLVDAESARNQVLSAADTFDDLSVDLAAAQAVSAAVRNAEACIQVHGGIGFTWEHPAHLLLRRALTDEASCARTEHLRDTAAARIFDRLG
ncbi:acyl-CoA dehydrogenase family protein [Gordonia amarae]|uniref:acyl-CoA dehydrogenase family protein n=1 Tax=Gordonia amarae TaxID=36821 RepID=UPI00058C13F4|nr:acyl-CoA dehydrogenase family protein [Gordonia amarae]